MLQLTQALLYIMAIYTNQLKLCWWDDLTAVQHEQQIWSELKLQNRPDTRWCFYLNIPLFDTVSFLVWCGITFLFTSGESSSCSRVSICQCVSPSVQTHNSATTSRNLFILGIMMGWSGNNVHIFKMLILCGITDPQTKISVAEKWSQVIAWEASKTAANIHSALLPLFTHHKGMPAHCKRVRMTDPLINFSDDPAVLWSSVWLLAQCRP